MNFWVPDWLLALLALSLFIYVYGTWNHNYFTKINIPFSTPLPIFGNMAPVIFQRISLYDFVQKIYSQFPNEKIVGFFEFNTPVFMIRDPEIIKQITVKDFEYFTDHRVEVSEESDPLFGKNLFTLKGDRWKNVRSTLSPTFTSSKMKAMFGLMENCGKQMADHIANKCKGSADGIWSLDIKTFYTKFTNDVIATTAFGIHCDSFENPDNEFYEMGKTVTGFSGIRALLFLLFMICPKLTQLIGFKVFPAKVTNFFRTLVHGTIATREKEGIVRPDMIHLMMQARKGTLKSDVTDDVTEQHDMKKAIDLSDDDITANAIMFFLAGFETTATTMSFMSLQLTLNPEIQRRVQEEIDAILEEEGKLTYGGIQRMKYLDMVLSETLRLYTPMPTSDRKCTRPYVIAATDTSPAIKLSAGDGIAIPQYAMQRDPEYFPDPERFDPERFNDENKQNINPFTNMPFGVGPRNCIGLRFAQMEVKIAISSILSRFNLEVISKTPTEIRLCKSIQLKPVGDFWVGLKPRTDIK